MASAQAGITCPCNTLQVVMTGVIPNTVPPAWQICDASLYLSFALLVGGHLLAPLVLNPIAMLVEY